MATHAFRPDCRAISRLAKVCVSLFTTYLDADPHDGDRADLQLQRFDVWASHVGIFASYSASLDKRLEYSDGTRGLIMHLLALMRFNLEFGMLSR